MKVADLYATLEERRRRRVLVRSPRIEMDNGEQRAGISIVIPAYNEEQRLPNTLSELQRYRANFKGGFEVIVVDDGSLDGTADFVQRQLSDKPWLSLLGCPHRGKGAAVRSGMLAAQHEHVILCDADLSMPVEQCDRLLKALDHGHDLAIGSRGLSESRRYDDPLRRRVMSRLFSILVHILVIRGVRDTQCGFKAFRRDVARDLFSRQALRGFSFDVEILFLARQLHYHVEEVAIDWYFNADSRVRTGRDTLSMVADLLHIRLRALLGAYREPRYQHVNQAIGSSDPGPHAEVAVSTLSTIE